MGNYRLWDEAYGILLSPRNMVTLVCVHVCLAFVCDYTCIHICVHADARKGHRVFCSFSTLSPETLGSQRGCLPSVLAILCP